jgi:hypothetical protein
MNRKISIAIIATTLLIFQTYGQGLKNNISLNYGVSHIARQDLVFTPFIHTDLSPISIGLEYTRTADYYQDIKLRFSVFDPMLISPYDYFIEGERNVAGQHVFTIINLDYAIGKIISQTGKSKIAIGALLATDVQSLNYAYGRIGSFGYYSTFGLGGFLSKDYQINERSYLVARFSLPLLYWLSRSPYLVNDDEFIENISSHSGVKSFFAFIGDGKLTTINKLQTFDLEAKYFYDLNDKWQLGIGYLFEFIHSTEPRGLLSYQNSLFLSTIFNF